MSPREERRAKNQTFFREVNERIVELAGQWSVQNLDLVCECANTGCAEIIHVPIGEYERIRQSPNLFLIVPGHLVDEGERVVERHVGYDFVEV